MAIIETARPAPTGAIATFRIVSALEHAAHAISEWNIERKTVSALSKLSDHELNDIGVARHEIRAFAKRG